MIQKFCTSCGEQFAASGLRHCTACGAAAAGDAGELLAQAMLGRRREAILLNIEAVRMLRQLDAEENAAALATRAETAATVAAGAAGRLPSLEEAVARAIRAERAADTRAREARGYAGTCAAADRRARRQHHGAAAQTEALVHARAAATVASGEEAALEGASAARAAAEAELARARQRAEQLEDAATAAQSAADAPPEVVPLSVWTALLAHPLILLGRESLSDEEAALVRLQASGVAELSGLAGQLRAEGASEKLREVAEGRVHSPVLVIGHDGAVTANLPGNLRGLD